MLAPRINFDYWGTRSAASQEVSFPGLLREPTWLPPMCPEVSTFRWKQNRAQQRLKYGHPQVRVVEIPRHMGAWICRLPVLTGEIQVWEFCLVHGKGLPEGNLIMIIVDHNHIMASIKVT
jgi:hypothetical protein